MNIFPVARYKFILNDEEVNALKIIHDIDCSVAYNCEGCPLSINLSDNKTRCIKHIINGVLNREGLNNDKTN